jgi:hypothetical protein
MVWEVGVEMEGVKGEEDHSHEEKQNLDDSDGSAGA